MLVVAGIALRIAVNFPSHQYPADADKLLSGIGAVRLLGGHLPVFFATPRWGAIVSYVVAPFLLVFGDPRTALAAANSTSIIRWLLFGAWVQPVSYANFFWARELALAALRCLQPYRRRLSAPGAMGWVTQRFWPCVPQRSGSRPGWGEVKPAGMPFSALAISVAGLGCGGLLSSLSRAQLPRLLG